MGPLTKKKYFKARQGERRSHLHLEQPPMNECPQCHSPKMPHRGCPTCGTYRGRGVLAVGSERRRPTGGA